MLKNNKVTGILASLLLSACMREPHVPTQQEEQLAKEVPAGKIEYNKGSLISHGFLSCSSVIFDYGTEAIMGHFLRDETYVYKGGNGIGTDDAIQAILALSREKGLDYTKAKVIIDAGASSSLETLIHDLHALGIEPTIRKNRIDSFQKAGLVSTTMFYNPATDSFSTRPTRDEDYKPSNVLEVY